MTVASDRRYVRGRRCPICGGADGDPRAQGVRCFGFLGSDELYAHCSREELAGPIQKSATGDTYAHRIVGTCKCGHPHVTPNANAPVRGVDIGPVVAEYNYYDEDNVLLYQVRRHEPKTFRQYRSDGKGGWIAGLDDKTTGKRTRRVLYRLPRVLAAPADVTIVIAEGERDVNALETLGFVATCNPMGALKWSQVHDCAKRALRGRNVVIIADDDSGKPDPDKGMRHALDVASRLDGVAASVRIVMPKRGHDAASWIEEGGTAEEIKATWMAVEPRGVADVVVTMPTGEGSYGLAVRYVRDHASHPDGPTLRRWRDGWYAWHASTGSYHALADDELDISVRAALGLSEPKEMYDVRKILGTVPEVTINRAELGQMIGGDPSREMVACQNGVLDLQTYRLTAVTPKMFTLAAVGAPFDEDAPPPVAWLEFLAQVFPGDTDSVSLLQEWFGYHLVQDTRQHKIMFLVGKGRSGKGTILRILNALIGEDNASTPTLDDLGRDFGLQTSIGKTAALIGDARIDHKTNMAALVSRMLSISGGDKQMINRKNMSHWIGYLRLRFTVACNFLPEFKDASAALMHRMLILRFTVSFLGREDLGLESRLRTELPGILLWSLTGLRRLRQRGHFVNPPSAASDIDDMIEVANPIVGWVRERCITGPDEECTCNEAYEDYKSWCEKEGERFLSKKIFGSRLKATGLVGTATARDGSAVRAVYRGISIRERMTP